MRTFEVTLTKKWLESDPNYFLADSHKEVAKKLERGNNRVMNDRFRQIEKTGEYYRVTEMCKCGKSLIYEIA